jgi:hypothetical protein
MGRYGGHSSMVHLPARAAFEKKLAVALAGIVG